MEHEIYAAGEGYFLCPMTDADIENYEKLQYSISGEVSEYLTTTQKNKVWEEALKGDVDRYFSLFDEHGDYCG